MEVAGKIVKKGSFMLILPDANILRVEGTIYTRVQDQI